MSAVLTSIRQRFAAQRETPETTAEDYRELVRMVADGEQPDDALLERLVSAVDTGPAAACPVTALHKSIRQICGTRFVCDECGTEFEHAGPLKLQDAPDGRKSLRQLERDVAILKERREWQALADTLPKLRRELQAAQSEQEASHQRLREASEAHRKLCERKFLPAIQTRIDIAESAADRLRRPCGF